ncbi:hypothetical protein C0J52_19747 [Blattella germanica]|nr:hypothetical protein C0J52_19747 [Blattella germanica]
MPNVPRQFPKEHQKLHCRDCVQEYHALLQIQDIRMHCPTYRGLQMSPRRRGLQVQTTEVSTLHDGVLRICRATGRNVASRNSSTHPTPRNYLVQIFHNT